MGRLPALTWSAAFAAMAGLAIAGATACNDPVKKGPSGRSDQVVSDKSAPTATTTPAVATHAAAAPRGPVCDKSVSGRALPKGGAAFVDETGTVTERAMPAWDGRRARWVSFFASWCGPCKEEMPRIRSFAQRLEQSGQPIDVTYLSIDDDLRQLTAFFAQQPAGGVKSSYWLKDGPGRTAWLSALKMKSDPPLPEHAIFDGKGHLRCFVSGAIEDGDYAEIAASLR
jgi:thiol-disulfide isomerase/thioredoxin